MRIRSVVLHALSLAALSVTAACDLGTSPQRNDRHASSFANAPGIPSPMVFVPESDESAAGIFHDDSANIDLIQVYAWDDTAGNGIFLQFPASAAATAGNVPLSAADVGVRGYFSTSREAEEWDQDWDFALHSLTLVVVTPGAAPGDVIAVSVSDGSFVFENEDGARNSAVTALVGSVTPAIEAELEDDPILGCW